MSHVFFQVVKGTNNEVLKAMELILKGEKHIHISYGLAIKIITNLLSLCFSFFTLDIVRALGKKMAFVRKQFYYTVP